MKNLNEMTIVELTALYNSKVNAVEQIKKFRTKDKAIARIEKLLTGKLKSFQTEGYVQILNPEPIEKKSDLGIISNAILYPEQLQNVAQEPDADKADLMIVDTQTEGYIRVICGERRKPVKGVVKLCRDLLVHNTEGENVISILAEKYIREGNYDEKTAKSSAQTILADTKKRMAVLVTA